jgi:hypothetical protein
VLDAGVTINTGPDSYVYLSVNGSMSAVRVSADTTLVLEKMDRIRPGREGDTDTMLNLQGRLHSGPGPKGLGQFQVRDHDSAWSGWNSRDGLVGDCHCAGQRPV